MGAEVFQVKYSGKSADKAFIEAVQSAQYSYGHDGYTGTIAEKGSYQIIESPIDDVEAFIEAVEDYACSQECIIDKKYEVIVKRASDIYDDKWGPALCIPLKEKAHNGDPFYLFCGWASS